MPYKLAKKGSKTCVIKEGSGESMGCHSDDKKAKAQLRALYASENDRKENDIVVNLFVKEAWENYVKEITLYDTGDDTDVDEKPLEEKGYDSDGYYRNVPFGATTYAELDAMRTAQERTAKINDLLAEFPIIASNIMMNPDVSDKASAINKLSSELVSRVGEANATKAISDKASEEHGDVTFADPVNKEHPIDTPEHIRAAWSYINKSSNASEYSGTQVNTIKRRIIAAWKNNIDKEGPPSAKKSWYETALEAVSDVMESIGLIEKEVDEEPQPLLIFKEVGTDNWRWLTRYSNNFRDDDLIPEIIAAESHRKFEEMVDKGLAPYPELWLWHISNWRIGQADWLAYDDTGFALAAGYFEKGMDDVAEWLSKQKTWKVSHGMPPKTVRRDRLDPTIIIEHVTKEISLLPGWAAANQLTGFVTVSKEAEMGIPDKKKEDLLNRLRMPAELLAKVEQHNAEDATKAAAEGIESKEKEQSAEVEAQAETEVQAEETSATPDTEIEPEAEKKVTAEDAQTEETVYVTAKEVAESVTSVFNPILKELNERIERLEGIETLVKELRRDRDDEVKETIANTPANSLLHLMQTRTIGNKVAEVDSEDSLAKSKPQETKLDKNGPTPVPFLNSFIQQEN